MNLGYYKLAVAILRQAYHDHDKSFLNTAWYRYLVETVGEYKPRFKRKVKKEKEKIKEEDKNEIKRLFTVEKWTYKEIAEHLGYENGTIFNYIVNKEAFNFEN